MEEEGIMLTPEMLKALSEKTKIQIMKDLLSGPRIPTDISRELNKSTPTIVEHLEKLISAGLVEKRTQEGRKYVFYALTTVGDDLVSSRRKISIVLYSSVILFVCGIAVFGTGYYSQAYSPFGVAALVSGSSSANVAGNANYPAVLATIASYQALSLSDIVAIALFCIAFILLLFYIREIRKFRITISG